METNPFENIVLEKSEHDKNNYKLFQLENGLHIFLINDRTSQKSDEKTLASFALSVNAGSFNDPPQR